MGGNVANGSPIGDSAPVLIALDAQLVLRQGERTRRLPLDDFYVDYMKNRLEPGEFVQAIEVPLAGFDPSLRAYKISKRFDSDISAVFVAFRIRARRQPVRDVRLAFGGMAAIVKRAPAAEARCSASRWDEATRATRRRGAGAGLQAVDRPARQRRLPPQVAATCCGASGSRRGRTDALPPHATRCGRVGSRVTARDEQAARRRC